MRKKSQLIGLFFASTCKNLHTFNVFEDNCQAKIIIFLLNYDKKIWMHHKILTKKPKNMWSKKKVKENEKNKSVDRVIFFASTCKKMHTFNVIWG